ncbi:auxin-induced protein 22d [Phtheirospermum japonicum]|uniref:Auxin-responsive protein n=1 Tax=Phtheirospermum japonicum TaxID=374723 RepID=A0A830CM94_9LAMI|nr:auxin-induced protein 22d [Phtheirospermum japonicum]
MAAAAEEESGDLKGVFVNKANIVGWSQVKSYQKNNIQQQKKTENKSGMFVKVSMNGAPYLRKIGLKLYTEYSDLLKAFEAMFKLTIGTNFLFFLVLDNQ